MISNVQVKGRKIYTKNLVPGKIVYGEQLVKVQGEEYRQWAPTRSKLGAALEKGTDYISLNEGEIVLYLGASSGTTVSHVSDIVGKDGFVFALDFAPRTTRELVFLCEQRKNVEPMLADAAKPETYKEDVVEKVDFVFQDIAQKNQVGIFLANDEMFLKSGGLGWI